MNIKTIIYRAVLPAALLPFFLMAGCGLYGPNDNSVENSTDTRLVGTWSGGQNPFFPGGTSGIVSDTYQFTYDGSFSDTCTPTGSVPTTVTGTYYIDNTTGELTLVTSYGTVEYYYQINSGESTLIIDYYGLYSGEQLYTRQ
ncbi:MAG: hypothetical protein ABSG94_04005 [Brevinematales bacterium]|jgi:hypothetical protein